MKPFVAPASANILHGEIAGSATASQLPDIPCFYAKIQAASDNAGTVYIGSSTSVTVKNGTTDVTTGFPITPGKTEEFMVGNLNQLWRICDNAGDDVLYIAYQ